MTVCVCAADGKRKAVDGLDSSYQTASKHLHDKRDSSLKPGLDRCDSTSITIMTEGQEGLELSVAVPWERGTRGGSDRDHSSDELNSKFRSQRLRSSSSSSSSSSSAYETPGPGGFDTPTPTPKPLLPVCVSFSMGRGPQSGTSMTLPKVRTPLTPRDSIQLVKKHHSQPQPALDCLHQVNVSIDIGSCTTPSRRSLAPASVSTLGVEETDIDETPSESMEGVVEGPTAESVTHDGDSFVGLAEELEMLDPDALKPPTPPLHRFPSWVGRTDPKYEGIFYRNRLPNWLIGLVSAILTQTNPDPLLSPLHLDHCKRIMI